MEMLDLRSRSNGQSKELENLFELLIFASKILIIFMLNNKTFLSEFYIINSVNKQTSGKNLSIRKM